MDPKLAIAGLFIGLLVGMTGMGGGSLMTPILVFLFGFKPTVAIGTDILHGAIFKSFGAVRHRQLGTVHLRLTGWMLLGSAPLLVQRGVTESLAGRFELIRVTHWSFAEMRDAFGWDLDTYLFYGGYPGAAPLVKSHDRWEEYILDSIVETNLSRDILLLNRVEKPALLRQLFRLACTYSGQVLSYTKMLGTLTDAVGKLGRGHQAGKACADVSARPSGSSPAVRRGSRDRRNRRAGCAAAPCAARRSARS